MHTRYILENNINKKNIKKMHIFFVYMHKKLYLCRVIRLTYLKLT